MAVKTRPRLSTGATLTPKISAVLPEKTISKKGKKITKYASVVLRPKRQLTLPREICEQMGIEPGDGLELSLAGNMLVAKAKKAIALDALREIQKVFQRSGITEEELFEEARKVRHVIIRKRYAAKE